LSGVDRLRDRDDKSRAALQEELESAEFDLDATAMLTISR
jgi:hypothetical protein